MFRSPLIKFYPKGTHRYPTRDASQSVQVELRTRSVHSLLNFHDTDDKEKEKQWQSSRFLRDNWIWKEQAQSPEKRDLQQDIKD